jgi:hypothetical protein
MHVEVLGVTMTWNPFTNGCTMKAELAGTTVKSFIEPLSEMTDVMKEYKHS